MDIGAFTAIKIRECEVFRRWIIGRLLKNGQPAGKELTAAEWEAEFTEWKRRT